jgi:hypothetical protein
VKSFLSYYHRSRTHVSLAKNKPQPLAVHSNELRAVVMEAYEKPAMKLAIRRDQVVPISENWLLRANRGSNICPCVAVSRVGWDLQ